MEDKLIGTAKAGHNAPHGPRPAAETRVWGEIFTEVEKRNFSVYKKKVPSPQQLLFQGQSSGTVSRNEEIQLFLTSNLAGAAVNDPFLPREGGTLSCRSDVTGRALSSHFRNNRSWKHNTGNQRARNARINLLCLIWHKRVNYKLLCNITPRLPPLPLAGWQSAVHASVSPLPASQLIKLTRASCCSARVRRSYPPRLLLLPCWHQLLLLSTFKCWVWTVAQITELMPLLLPSFLFGRAFKLQT